MSRDEATEALNTFAAQLEKGHLTPATVEQLAGVPALATTNETTDESVVDTSGCFLVRYSERKGAGTGYVLTLLWNKAIKNFIISQSVSVRNAAFKSKQHCSFSVLQSKYLYIDNGPYLPTLDHLIEHFMRFSDGLPVNLKYAVPPKPKPPLPLFSTMPRTQKRSISESPLVSPQGCGAAAPHQVSALREEVYD